MTVTQVSVNASAIRNLADKLTRLGYERDDVHDIAEKLAMNLLADGYRRIETPPALRPTNAATAAQRAAHIEAAKAEVEAARRKRQETK